jgi:hypothetical protein
MNEAKALIAIAERFGEMDDRNVCVEASRLLRGSGPLVEIGSHQ